MLTPSLPTEASAGLPLSARRRIQAGMVVTSAAGAPRTGVLAAASASLVTGTADLAMTYQIGQFVAATSRDGVGVEFVGNDATETVSTTAAPGSNSRIDVIWVRCRFPSLTDSGLTAPLFGVTQGVANASPSKPSIPAGALELATAVVTSSDLATQTVVISNTFRWTAYTGGVVPLRSAGEAAAWSPADGAKAYRLDLGAEFTRSGGQWVASNALGVVTDGNVVAGTAWDGKSPLRTIYLSGSPQVDGSSVTTLTFPGGGFPNFVLIPKVTLMSGGFAKQAVVSAISKTGMSIQILTGAGAALAPNTAVPLAVEVIGG